MYPALDFNSLPHTQKKKKKTVESHVITVINERLIVNQRAAHYFKKKMRERERKSIHVDYNESCCLLFTEGEHKLHSDSFNSQQPHCAVSPSEPKNRKKKIYLAAITVTVPQTGIMCSNYMHT